MVWGTVLVGLAAIVSFLVLELKRLRAIVIAANPAIGATPLPAAIAAEPRATVLEAIVAKKPLPVRRGLGVVGEA